MNEDQRNYTHPLYSRLEQMGGLSVGLARLDQLLTWGSKNALWVFPMATSCCGIEFMAAACSRFDMDRIGSIARGTPRQCDVMVVAGPITVQLAPRVKKLWDQMPEPKWCIAMGSCAISGDFYRDIYSVVPGIDTFIPVDVYVPGCPPNPDALLLGMRRLQEKIEKQRRGEWVEPERRPETYGFKRPSLPRMGDPARRDYDDGDLDVAQLRACQQLDPGGALRRAGAPPLVDEAPVEAPDDSEGDSP